MRALPSQEAYGRTSLTVSYHHIRQQVRPQTQCPVITPHEYYRFIVLAFGVLLKNVGCSSSSFPYFKDFLFTVFLCVAGTVAA